MPIKVQGKGKQSTPSEGQEFCDIFGNKGDTSWQMIMGDNPTGHGFVVRDLVLFELLGHAPHSSLGERVKGGGLKISEKIFLGAGSEILMLVVVLVVV